jgi:hypothetical protein
MTPVIRRRLGLGSVPCLNSPSDPNHQRSPLILVHVRPARSSSSQLLPISIDYLKSFSGQWLCLLSQLKLLCAQIAIAHFPVSGLFFSFLC